MQKPINILHLEDNPLDAELIQATLDSASILCKITRVQTSQEFSDALQMGGFNLVLADFNLPTYDGMSAMRFVRKHYPDIPFIFISGIMGDDSAIQALTEGATDYVLKQKLSRIVPAVRRALQDAENRAERRRSEAALRESEQRYRSLFEESFDGLFITSPAGKFLDMNKKGIQMFGYDTKEEILSLDLERDIYAYPADRKRILDMLNVQGSAEYEIIAKKKSGELMVTLCSLTTVKDEQGVVTAYRGIIRDITERKQVEDALYKSERHSQSLLRLSKNLERAQTYAEVLNAARDEVKDVIGYQNLWVYLLTEDKKYAKALIAGGAFETMVMSEEGTATLTIKGDRMLEEIAEAKEIVVVEDARTDERTDKEIVARMGNRTIVNVPIILFDRHLGSIGTGTFGDEGVRPPTNSERDYLSALASHIAVTLDRIHLLTERKRAEAELERRQILFRALFARSPDAVVVIDPHDPNNSWPIIDCNAATCLMSGYSREELIGHSIDILNVTPGTQAERIAYLKKLRDAGNLKIETHHRRKNGIVFPVEVTTSLVAVGERELIIGIDRDITERRQAEISLRESEQRFQLASWATKDVIWERNLSANTISWNNSLLKLFHYSADEIEPTVEWWQDHIHPAERIKVIKSIQVALEQGENFWSEEYRLRLVDGSYANIFDRGYIRLYRK